MSDFSQQLSTGLNLPSQGGLRIAVGTRLVLSSGRWLVTGILRPAPKQGLASNAAGTRFTLEGPDGEYQTLLERVVYSDPALRVMDDLDNRAFELAEHEGRDPVTEAIAERVARRKQDLTAVMDKVPDAELMRVFKLEAEILEYTTGYRSYEDMLDPEKQPNPDYVDKGNLLDREQRKADQIGIPAGTLSRLRRAYEKPTGGLPALVNQTKVKSSDPTRNIPSQVIAAMREQYLVREKGDSLNGGLSRFRRRVQDFLDLTYGVGTHPLPADSTLRGWVRAVVPQVLADKDSRTRKTQTPEPETSFANVRATRPGEVVFMDESPLDIKGYDPDSGKTIDLSLVIALDLFSRSLLAWRLVPRAATQTDAILMLADCLTPMVLRPDWEEDLSWRALSLPFQRLVELDQRLADAAAKPIIWPERIVVDNGKIFISRAFKAACLRLQIDLTLAKEATPTHKPHVERAFDTINTMFSRHVAGYTGGRVNWRGDSPEEDARWSLDELEEMFDEFIVSVYQRRSHEGLWLANETNVGLSPNDAYALGVQYSGFVMAPPSPQLYYELLPVKWVKIHSFGVELNGLRYDDPDVLRGRRNTKSNYPQASGKWPIRFDQRNLLEVFFRDPDTGQYEALRWREATPHTQPFADSLLAHVRRLLRERGRVNPLETEVRDELEALQRKSDAQERTNARTTKTLRRSKDKARNAARDRGRHASESAGRDPKPLPARDDLLDLDALHVLPSFDFDRVAEGVDAEENRR